MCDLLRSIYFQIKGGQDGLGLTGDAIFVENIRLLEQGFKKMPL